ncbi:MAG: hypothetical protein DI586_07375 [Micavibrio aeruginosavorus]|uniref:Uncharacterized protein n=1 Tax=Micavibrio aeruginosavorus TaxID=349221 RepID=A0A2W5FJW6_9BACT|nr:MAG: hypothetical protein DI586_07375 [Micavibrio aeruginosavorus]
MSSKSNSPVPTLLAIFALAGTAGYYVTQLIPSDNNTYTHQQTREEFLEANGYRNIQMADFANSDKSWILKDCLKGETSQHFSAQNSIGISVRGITCKSIWSQEIRIVDIQPVNEPQ